MWKLKPEVEGRLIEIAHERGGVLTPEAVIADARKSSSPLHQEFEWNVKKAAYAHWEHRAKCLISSIRVEYTTRERVIAVPAYVKDPNAEPAQYVDIMAIKNDMDTAREIFAAEAKKIETALRRLDKIGRVLGVVDEVVKMQAAYDRIKYRVYSDTQEQPGAVN